VPGLEFSDERSLDDLIDPVGREYIHPLRVKWQLPGNWRAGDEVPHPLDLSSFADQLGMQPELAKVLDDKMTSTFKDAMAEQPIELLPVEFAAQPINEADEWWRQNYGGA
jgi:hypothetical protein